MDADERTPTLRRLHEHLIAAGQLAERLALVYEWRTFPARVLKDIIAGELAAVVDPDAMRAVAAEMLREDPETDPADHPTPSGTHSPLSSPDVTPHEDTRRIDARQDRDQT